MLGVLNLIGSSQAKKSQKCQVCPLSVKGRFGIFLCRPKAGDSSSDEEAKEVSAVSCQDRLQTGDAQPHLSQHTYRKSLRLSSDQIVSFIYSLHNISY